MEIFEKKLIFSAANVDLCIYQENPPESPYRLLPTKHAAVDGVKDYIPFLKDLLFTVSHQQLTKITIPQGFTVVLGNSRLYFLCQHINEKRHCIYFKTEDLKPGKSLKMTWVVKCGECKQLIPTDAEQTRNVCDDLNIQNPQSGRRNITNPQRHFNVNVNLGNTANPLNEIALKFKEVATELSSILENAFLECNQAENPTHKALEIKNIISVKLIEAYSNVFTKQVNLEPTPGCSGLSPVAAQMARQAAENRRIEAEAEERRLVEEALQEAEDLRRQQEADRVHLEENRRIEAEAEERRLVEAAIEEAENFRRQQVAAQIERQAAENRRIQAEATEIRIREAAIKEAEDLRLQYEAARALETENQRIQGEVEGIRIREAAMQETEDLRPMQENKINEQNDDKIETVGSAKENGNIQITKRKQPDRKNIAKSNTGSAANRGGRGGSSIKKYFKKN